MIQTASLIDKSEGRFIRDEALSYRPTSILNGKMEIHHCFVPHAACFVESQCQNFRICRNFSD